jgi:hypothetical protein
MSDTLLRGKFNCLGKVTASGYKYDGSPRDYEMNNPTGYMTGQWIDVEVTEVSSVPSLYSKKTLNLENVSRVFGLTGGIPALLASHKWVMLLAIMRQNMLMFGRRFLEPQKPRHQPVRSPQ